MESRRVQDFVVEAIQIISQIPKDNVDFLSLPESKRAVAVLVQLEADSAFGRLIKLLNDHTLSLQSISAETLKPFYRFLSERWELIQKTDTMYTFMPDSHINKACISLAELLSKIDDTPVFDLLMPPLRSANHDFAQQGDLTNLQLHQFIIGNDGAPLSIELCFQFLEYKAEFDRARTSSSNGLGGNLSRSPKSSFNPPMRSLTLEEEQLVANHSVEAAQYYVAIKTNQNVREAREAFLKAIRSNKYKVTSSYEEEGMNRLAGGVLREVRSPYTLSDIMCDSVPMQQWSAFLGSIKNEDLFKIVLGIDLAGLKRNNPSAEKYKEAQLQKTDDVLLALSKGNFTFKDENHLRAYMLCLNQVYRISRQEGPEFKTSTGYYFGYYLSWAHSREQKMKSSDVFRDFLLSDPPHPIHDLEGYLRKRKLYDQHWGPLTTFTTFGYNTLPNLIQLAVNCSKQFLQKKSSALVH
jgi:hypothetical protein